MQEIVFATNNRHKLREIRDIIRGRWQILGLEDINCHEAIPETAATLEGNALLKARFVNQIYGKDCFADDTGLEVKCLDGLPGVNSARYAGDECIASNNISKLLREMSGCSDREARFRTVIALIIKGKEYLFEGIVNGIIIHEARGKMGFGYDPIFIPEGYQQTFAEMDPDLKNRISHRGKATLKLSSFLHQHISGA